MVILSSSIIVIVLIILILRCLKLASWFEWVCISLLLSKSTKWRKLVWVLVLLRKIWLELSLILLLKTTLLIVVKGRTILRITFYSAKLWTRLTTSFVKIKTTKLVVKSIISLLLILLLHLRRCLTKFKSRTRITISIWLRKI